MYIAVTLFGMSNTNGHAAAVFAMLAMPHYFFHHPNMQRSRYGDCVSDPDESAL